MRRQWQRRALLAIAAGAIVFGNGGTARPSASPEDQVTITGVAAGHSSIKISFAPVEGAADYRAYDVLNPQNVKYAGLVQQGDGGAVPATEIDWNLAGDGESHMLVVEAVDQLGPVPAGSLYDPDTNAPFLSVHAAGAMLGGNKGETIDGRTSTNGQGPFTNDPQVIARSEPFPVQVDRSAVAVPSSPLATSVFFDTFENAEGGTLAMTSSDADAGTMTYTLNGGTPLSATIAYRAADVINSMPFISGDHFMDVLFDGGTPGTNNPLHQGRAVMAYSPDSAADWGASQVLHITQEVDGHKDSRRWMDMLVVPADDPAVNFDGDNGPLNSSNRGVLLQLFDDDACTLDIFTGPRGGDTPTGTAGGANGSRLWGASGQALFNCDGRPGADAGFDNKVRYDLFLSARHAALFANGQLLRHSAIQPGTFDWAGSPVKIYFSHYVYHTENDVSELLLYHCSAVNAFWFNDPIRGTTADQNACGVDYPPGFGFPHSDERHWDNMGFEVLPSRFSSGDVVSQVTRLIRLPQRKPVAAR